MTQPAMSQHLASLEAEVGEPLFTRAPRKMIPTERGKALYTQVVPHIGSFQMRVIAYLGAASKILEFLLEEKVDLIVMSQKLSAPGVEYIPYMQEEFALVAPPHYSEPTFDDKESFESWLCSQPWISYDLDLPIIRRFWREHFQKRPQTHPTHVVPDLHGVLKAIEHGAGISLLPTFMLNDHLSRNKVKIMYPSYTVHNDLYLAYQVKNRNLPHLKTLIDALKKAV